MIERRFRPRDFDWLAVFAAQLDCMPPNAKAYEALKESFKLCLGIRGGDINDISGISKGKFEAIRAGIIAKSEKDPKRKLFENALLEIDRFLCKKYKIKIEEMGDALDWQLRRIEEMRALGKFN